MKRFRILLLVGLLAANAGAVIVLRFPGLETLIEKADAIVVLRVDQHLDPPNAGVDFYTTHHCFIYQTLKGDIKSRTHLALQLMDPRSAPVNHFATYSHHLVFLTKKRSPNEPTEYRTIEIEGADIRLSPHDNETMPEGKTTAEQIRSLLKTANAYWTKKQLQETEFLQTMGAEKSP